MTFGPGPWLQPHWDGRAAANFIAGGAGSGLVVFTTLAGGPAWAHALGAALVALGLAAVALEIGRPMRSPGLADGTFGAHGEQRSRRASTRRGFRRDAASHPAGRPGALRP